MRLNDISKYLFYIITGACILSLAFVFGLYNGRQQTGTYRYLENIATHINDSILLIWNEASTLTKVHPTHFLQPTRYEGSGATVNNVENIKQHQLIFMSGFFDGGNELRLIERDGSIVNRWPVSFSSIFPDASHIMRPPTTDWNVDIHGSIALPDGAVVFNFEYGGLVKLDKLNRIVWKLKRPTHHSVELAEDGGFWAPCRRYHSEENETVFPPFTPPFFEDTIIKISRDGKIEYEISVPMLFYKNGLEALLTATGEPLDEEYFKDRDIEIVHLNKIEQLSANIADIFPMFEAGDLALSMRDRNLIFIVSPESWKIKWWKIGPWVRQHDPEFSPHGKLYVFNNNHYQTAFGSKSDRRPIDAPKLSNIMEIDPLTNQCKIIYGQTKKQKFSSIIRGKIELTKNDGFLITEFEGGRVFEINSKGEIIWEYINKYDSDEVAEITEARLYSPEYFDENVYKEWMKDKK